MNYNGLNFDRDELASAMLTAYEELLSFVSTPEFRTLHKELMDLDPAQRPAFVVSVILQSKELEKRGISVPPGILIQTSAFGDRRPTLFAVKKFLPEKYHGAWENVNLTFFNEFKDEDISRDPVDAWRAPLRVGLQNALLARGIDLEQVPGGYGLNTNIYELPKRAAYTE